MKTTIQRLYNNYILPYLRYIIPIVFLLIPTMFTLYYHNRYKIYYNKYNDIINAPIKSDTITKTIIKYDTICKIKPIVKTNNIINYDTVYVGQNSIINDSSVVLPKIHKTYTDSLYYAAITGYYDISLDTINVYPKTIYTNTIITNDKIIKEKRKKFGLGINFGYGIQYNYYNAKNKLNYGPYIGIGLQYNIWSF